MQSATSGRVIIVTGASSGIGAATAELFSSSNSCCLALVGRNTEDLKKTATKCTQNGAQTLIIKADVTNKSDVESIIKETVAKFGKIDVLINNAGVFENGSIETAPMEQFDRIMQLDLRATVQLSKAAIPHLIKSKGNIVNVSSIVGLRSLYFQFPNILSCCTARAALNQATRCMALDLAPNQVRVNAVCPGVIDTGHLLRTGIMNEEQHDAFLEAAKTTHPLGRPGTPAEVAQAISFLASEGASFITGVTLPVDGGRQATCL